MFKKLKQNRMYEDIVDQVLEAILRGDLKPNDKLPSEKELGNTFGVSRVTVREAIRSLEQFGMIEVRQGSMGGAYVKEMDTNAVVGQIENVLKMTNTTFQHLREARAAIEETVLKRLLPSGIAEEDFSRLEQNIAAAREHFKAKRDRQRLQTNFEFHTMIVEMTQNPVLILMHKLIINLSFSFFDKVKPSSSMIKNTLNNHQMIVDLLKKKDFKKAADVCFNHINEVSNSIIQKSKQQSLLDIYK